MIFLDIKTKTDIIIFRPDTEFVSRPEQRRSEAICNGAPFFYVQMPKDCAKTMAVKTKTPKKINRILKDREKTSSELIEVLQDVQGIYNYLPEETLRTVSEELEVPLIEVFRVANFYKAFSLKPRGKHLLTVCMGTACHVRGAPKFLDEVLGQLNVKPGETTDDGKFTVETVNCLGACALGPVVVLDKKYYDHMTPAKLRALIQKTPKEKGRGKKRKKK